MDPVLTGALIWLFQRLLDKGFDRVFDSVFDPPPQPYRAIAQPVMVTARRHDLSTGGQGTSDLDVVVRHHLAQTRVPVLLTFQKFGTDTGGTTFPMVLGDTASLTLRRDHYAITALIVDLPRTPGAKPTLRGVGWSTQWVADNHVKKVTLNTQHPTKELVKKLGLMAEDGTCPFILPAAPPKALPAAAPPGSPDFIQNVLSQHLRDARQTARDNVLLPRKPATPPKFVTPAPAATDFSKFAFTQTCRARVGVLGGQCRLLVRQGKLCIKHTRQVDDGLMVYDFQTGERIRNV